MDGKKQIVIWFLPCLGDGVEFSLVATAVVGLGLTGNGTDEVGMNAHGKAEHIYSFGDVGLPVASGFVVVDFIDDDIVLLFAVGSYVKGGKEDFSCVFGSCEEVYDVLLFLDDSFLLLLAVSYSLGTEYRIPKLIANLNVVLQRCGVLKLRFLCDSYEPLDGLPLALEKGGVIRDGIIGAVRGWDACDDGELAFLSAIL